MSNYFSQTAVFGRNHHFQEQNYVNVVWYMKQIITSNILKDLRMKYSGTEEQKKSIGLLGN